MAGAPVLPQAGIDIVWHTLRVGVDDVDVGMTIDPVNPNEAFFEEILEFSGRMKIQRGDPFTNMEGYRQVNFEVLDWTAVALSDYLAPPGQSLEIKYQKAAVPQPVSTIISEQLATDFPVRFKFNLIFDAFANGVLVFPQHHGMPEGGGFLTVPPDGNSPVITTFEDALIMIGHPMLGIVQFIPLDCQDQRSSTIPEPNGLVLIGSACVLIVAHKIVARRRHENLRMARMSDCR
jgi:hypothetical protein